MAMFNMAKQVVAVYDMVGDQKEGTVEEIEDKFKDTAVYSLICIILSEMHKNIKEKIRGGELPDLGPEIECLLVPYLYDKIGNKINKLLQKLGAHPLQKKWVAITFPSGTSKEFDVFNVPAIITKKIEKIKVRNKDLLFINFYIQYSDL